MQVYGIDGCKGGWVVASQLADVSVTFTVVEDLTTLFLGDSYIAIDVPIGLPECGPRVCDLDARKQLPGQGSRVFPVPCRAAIGGDSYADCCYRNERMCGKRLSKQTHAIIPKIREVDRQITAQLQKRVREAHPEVSFRVIGGARLEHSKKRKAGQQERLRVLERNDIRFDAAAERLRLGRRNLAIDDLLDAAICLVTARRIASGAAEVLGDQSVDARGLRMEIVA